MAAGTALKIVDNHYTVSVGDFAAIGKAGQLRTHLGDTVCVDFGEGEPRSLAAHVEQGSAPSAAQAPAVPARKAAPQPAPQGARGG